MSKVTQEKKNEAIEYLRSILQSGDNLLITLKHRSSAGTTRYMKVQFSPKRGEYLTLTYHIGIALGYTMRNIQDENTLVFSGCGFSAANEIRRDLSFILFGEYDKLTYQGNW